MLKDDSPTEFVHQSHASLNNNLIEGMVKYRFNSEVRHPRCVELKLLWVRSAVNHNYMYCMLCGGIHSEYLL
jgi:hypothetical protein